MAAPFLTRAALVAIGLMLAAPVAPALAQDRSFDAAGVRIRFIEQGRGEPVVLLHGIDNSLQAWVDAGIVDALARTHRVIAFDARGHGKSDKPHDPAKYGREMARDVVRLLDHLGIAQAHVVGYSMGGHTTSQLLTLHPERILTATLAAGAGRFDWTAEDARLVEVEAAEREKECLSRTMIARLIPPGAPAMSEEQFAKRSAACFANPDQDTRAMAALVRGRHDTVIAPERAAAVTVPTLGIVGTRDPVLANLQRLKAIRPSLVLVTVEGAVHSSAAPDGLMRSPVFLEAMRTFIETRGRQTTRAPQ